MNFDEMYGLWDSQIWRFRRIFMKFIPVDTHAEDCSVYNGRNFDVKNQKEEDGEKYF